MQKIFLRRDESFPTKEWVRRRAYNNHASRSLQSDVIAYDEMSGDFLFAFIRVPQSIPVEPLLQTLESISYDRAYRTEGLLSTSKTFGAQPRIPIRRDYCAMAGLSYQDPAAHETLIQYGAHAAALFRELQPERYAAQVAALEEKVLPIWRSHHFTSGIVNRKNVLTYHRDQGNFPDSLSTMFSVSRDLHSESGRLVMPEYDVSIQFDGFEMLLFSGSQILHGVTPIAVMSKTSMRYTIVYYPLMGMTRCGTPEQELARIREVKTKREAARHSRNKAQLQAALLAGNKLTPEELEKAAERKRRLFETRTRKVPKR